MLPEDLPLKKIDHSILELVVNLNRLRGVYTMTTCHGHVYRDLPDMPTKDGWIYVVLPPEHQPLTESISRFCGANSEGYPRFVLDDLLKIYTTDLHAIRAQFEPYDDRRGKKLYTSPEDLEAYYVRAEEQARLMASRWSQLNAVVCKHLTEKFGPSFTDLPFRGRPPVDARSRMRCF